MEEKKTWADVWKDPVLLVTFWVTLQFFVLIILFAFWTGTVRMGEEAKMIILQAYVVAFTASWGFWLGSSASSRAKDATINKQLEPEGAKPDA